MIQVDTNKQSLSSQGEVTRSKVYGARILRVSSGMTLAWNSPRDQVTALAGALYLFPAGVTGLWVSGAGTIVLEYIDDPKEDLPPVSVAGASLDGAGNSVVVGPSAHGVANTGSPVYVAGRNTSDGTTLEIPVAPNGVAPAFLPIGGFSGGLSTPVPLGADGSGRLLPAEETNDFSGTSPAAASTVVGATYFPAAAYRRAQLHVRIQGATGGTLDIYLQTRIGGIWVDVVHFAQLAAAAGLIADAAVVNPDSAVPAAPLTGLNTTDNTPTLAAASVRNLCGDAWRVVYVAGAGTSAGAAQTIKLQLN